MAKFNAPVIQDNPSGWGPCAVPEKFKDMPYQPFSKGDRLGKVRLLAPAAGWLVRLWSAPGWPGFLMLPVPRFRLLTGLEPLTKTRDTPVSEAQLC